MLIKCFNHNYSLITWLWHWIRRYWMLHWRLILLWSILGSCLRIALFERDKQRNSLLGKNVYWWLVSWCLSALLTLVLDTVLLSLYCSLDSLELEPCALQMWQQLALKNTKKKQYDQWMFEYLIPLLFFLVHAKRHLVGNMRNAQGTKKKKLSTFSTYDSRCTWLDFISTSKFSCQTHPQQYEST